MRTDYRTQLLLDLDVLDAIPRQGDLEEVVQYRDTLARCRIRVESLSWIERRGWMVLYEQLPYKNDPDYQSPRARFGVALKDLARVSLEPDVSDAKRQTRIAEFREVHPQYVAEHRSDV